MHPSRIALALALVAGGCESSDRDVRVVTVKATTAQAPADAAVPDHRVMLAAPRMNSASWSPLGRWAHFDGLIVDPRQRRVVARVEASLLSAR